MKFITPHTALSIATLLVAAFVPSTFAQMWTFDSDSQGWQIADFPGTGDYTPAFAEFPVTYHSTMGASGGYISGLDPSDGTFLFQAPTSQLGNYTGYLGGKLSFSLQTDQEANWFLDSVVVFRNASSGLTIIAPLAQPGSTWTGYSIDLVASSFRYNNLSGGVVSTSDFAAVLGDLGTFLINGEYHTGVSETTGLDSVIFAQAAGEGSPVPEPSTYAAIGTVVLVGLAARRFCARRRG